MSVCLDHSVAPSACCVHVSELAVPIQVCDDSQRQLLMARITAHLNQLKKLTYGKHIVARVEKLLVAGNAAAVQQVRPSSGALCGSSACCLYCLGMGTCMPGLGWCGGGGRADLKPPKLCSCCYLDVA